VWLVAFIRVFEFGLQKSMNFLCQELYYEKHFLYDNF
jgi:hypothetical protein